MGSKKIKYFAIGLLIITVFFSLKIINDEMERNLTSLINYKPSEFHSMGVISDISKVEDDTGFEWFTKDKEPTDGLMKFLSQYSVKKINEKKFNEMKDNGGHLEVDIYYSNANPNPSIVRLYENKDHILNDKYYEVENGPIYVDWIRKYNEKHKDLYEE